MTTDSPVTAPLLALHSDRLDRLTRAYININDGDELAGHWLLQEAIDTEIITWDRTLWGRPLFSAEIRNGELVVGFDVTGQVDLSRTAQVAVPRPEDNAVESCPPMPDPTHRPAEFLRIVVEEINELHLAATRMVATWPGNTGIPMLP